MRVDVSKFIFVGAQSDRDVFLKKAQVAGCVEFIHPKGEKFARVPLEAERYAQAIKCLRGYTILPQEKKHNLELAEEICHEVLTAKQQKHEALEHIELIQHEILRIQPFGSFPLSLLEDIEASTGRRVRFYCAKTSKALDEKEPTLLFINSLDGIDYFITIEKEGLLLPDLIEEHITQELHTLLQEKQKLHEKVHNLDEHLKSLTKYSWVLHYAFYKKLDAAGLDFASHSSEHALDETLFTIQGWVPDNKKDAVTRCCKDVFVLMEEVKTEEHETAPTYLENKRLARVGEDLVHIFDTPSPTDKDPSVWLLVCFSLFFAMIVGDAGYGFIFLISALVLQYKIKTKKDFVNRFLKLMTILSVSCILWGLLTNSFFGIAFSPSNPLREYSLINWLIEQKAQYHLGIQDSTYQEWVKKIPQLKEATTAKEFLYMTATPKDPQGPIAAKFADNLAMELALFIGSIHLISGMFRYLGRHIAGAGWIAFVIGAYLYIPYYLGAASLVNFAFGIDQAQGAAFGLQLLCGGLVFVLIVSLFTKGLLGVFEIMTSIQIFSDVLSYLRIYALGLAGAIMSATINELAAGVPLFIAIIMLIFAHGINIILSIMGGTIHGLRLNFLEWYHYSFEGGGKRFSPLEIHAFE